LRKTPIFFAENFRKSQEIVIITSTPGPAEILADKHLVKSPLISTLSKATYFIGTILEGSTSGLPDGFFTNQKIGTFWKA
jgi:hypothetical protein